MGLLSCTTTDAACKPRRQKVLPFLTLHAGYRGPACELSNAEQTDGYVIVRNVRSTGESRRLGGEKVHYRSQFTQMMMEGGGNLWKGAPAL